MPAVEMLINIIKYKKIIKVQHFKRFHVDSKTCSLIFFLIYSDSDKDQETMNETGGESNRAAGGGEGVVRLCVH